MKHRIILLIAILAASSFCYAQTDNSHNDKHTHNKQQDLIDLLTSGKYFEARELYNELENEKSLELFDILFYKYKMALFENKSDYAVLYLEKLLTDFRKNEFAALPYYYDDLWGLYFSSQDYKKSIETSKRMQQFIRKNPFNINRDSLATWEIPIKNQIKRMRCWDKQKKIRVERSDAPSFVNINDTALIVFDATYNGKKFRTMFDTGVTSYFAIKKQAAIEMGLRKVNRSKYESIWINATDIEGGEYIADSIEFAGIKLYNIPVSVYDFDILPLVPDSVLNNPEKRKKIDEGIKTMEVIIGLPAMLLLKRFIIDWDQKTITFPQSETEHQATKENNSYLFYNKLYALAKLNDLPFTVQVDTGSDSYIDIDSLFYEKHKTKIPLDTLVEKKPLNISMVHTVQLNIPYEIPKNLSVRFDNKTINYLPNDTVQIYNLKSFWPTNFFDGVIGYKFIRSLGNKVLFDFEDMRIEAVEEKNKTYEEGTDCHHSISK